MNSKFLKYYFEKDLYLENPPMNMEKFIDFCKKRGIKINKDKLEDLEMKKLFYPIFRVTNIYNPISQQLVAPSFSERCHDDLMNYLNNGNIYIPQDNEFVEFSQISFIILYYHSLIIIFGFQLVFFVLCGHV